MTFKMTECLIDSVICFDKERWSGCWIPQWSSKPLGSAYLFNALLAILLDFRFIASGNETYDDFWQSGIPQFLANIPSGLSVLNFHCFLFS